MADERIDYKFTVDSSGAIRNLQSFDAALERIEHTVNDTIAPLGALGNLIKQTANAGDLKVTAESMDALYASINKTLDPCTQLLKLYKQFSVENTKLNSVLQTVQQATGKAFSEEAVAKFTNYIQQAENPAETLNAVFREVKSNLYGTITPAEQVDNAIKKQANDAKGTAKESARVFTEAVKHQNDYNASVRGAVHVSKTITKSAKESASAFKQLADNVKKSTRSFDAFKDSLKKSASSLRNNVRSLVNLNTSLARTAKLSKMVGRVAKTGLGIVLGKALANGAKEAINYYETLNLFNVAMKESVAQGKEFIHNISEWYGLDPKNLMQYTGMFYEMAYAVGAPDEAARKLSTSMTALSVDIASLFNKDVEKVTTDLTSGMRGMSRSVVKYGLDLRATTVQQFALQHGITESYSEMNEASREILRYLVAVKQARDATGDFAETIERPANQLRVFKEQITQFGRAVGNFIVKPLSMALPVINGFIMAMRILVETIAALFGFQQKEDPIRSMGESADNAAAGIGGIGAAADETKKKLKGMLLPIDELNIMQENKSADAGGGGGLDFGAVDPKLLELLDASEYKLQKVRMAAMDTRDAILEFFGVRPDGDSWVYIPELFEMNLLIAAHEWKETIQALFEFDYSAFLGNIKQMFSTFAQIARDAVFQVINDFGQLLGLDFSDSSIASWIEGLNDKFSNFNKFLKEHQKTLTNVLAKVIEFKIAVTIFNKLAKVIGAIHAVLSPVLGIVAAFAKPLVVLMGTLGGVKAVLAALATVGAALFIGGFIDWAAHSDTFKEHLERWKDSLSDIFKGLGTIIKATFDGIRNGIKFCSEHFAWLYDSIAGVIDGVLEVLAGLTEFVAGVFTADWKRAWKGVTRALDGILVGLANIVKAPINAVIAVLNGLVSGVIKAFNSVKRVINSLHLHIPDWVPLFGGKSIGFDLKMSTAPQIAYLANGGVVTGPTHAMIGEGRYDEAVIPLGNSPQMAELVQRIADANDSATVVARLDTLIEVLRNKDTNAYLDGRLVARYMYPAMQEEQKSHGTNFVRRGTL